MIELTEASTQHPVDLVLGESLQVVLAETRTTGFQWSLAADCKPILTQQADTVTPPAPQAGAPAQPGAPGRHTWRFLAATPGACTLRFISSRPWDRTATGKAIAFSIAVRPAA